MRRGLEVPFRVLLLSVLVFVVIPLALGAGSRALLVARRGAAWFEERFVRAFAPVTTAALLATLVLIFAFQAENITGRWLHVLLIAVPILIQVYFNSSLTYGLMKLAGVEYAVAAPGRADRRVELLRARRGDGDRALRSRLGRGPGDRRRRPRRSPGDALGLPGLRRDAPLVPGERRLKRIASN